MYHICEKDYISSKNYSSIFEKYPFPLDTFQKYAIEAIEEGHNVLVAVPTGSGKSLPGEYAIKKFCEAGKKVIYTSPIKALSNQKHKEFSKKFPNISFGIVTGDTNNNSDADCLIMTTEILWKTLFQTRMKENKSINADKIELHFNLKVEDIGAVIFDEFHYINDRFRGHVWKQTVKMLPKEVVQVYLSATIKITPIFLKWLGSNKMTWVSTSKKRIVPLQHYSFYTELGRQEIDKISNADFRDFVNNNTGKLVIIKNQGEPFDERKYQELVRIEKYMKNKFLYSNDSFTINELIKILKRKNMVPALFFVFSRKGVEMLANKVTIQVSEDKGVNIKEECKKKMMTLSNWQEYIETIEYTTIVKLIEKGIGIHHAGMIGVFKELVEVMYDEGYIKVLFATETFKVGINMPTKTVVFTSLKKYDGEKNRYLTSEEYTQMAGRAGRRGLDTEGHVIHLCNLFKLPTKEIYSRMVTNSPQKIDTESEIDCNLILRLHSIGCEDTIGFIQNNILDTSIDEEKEYYKKKLKETIYKSDELSSYIVSMNYENSLLVEYDTLLTKLPMTRKSLYKKTKERIEEIESNHSSIKDDIHVYQNYKKYTDDINSIERSIRNLDNYISNVVDKIETYLEDNYLFTNNELTLKGQLAANINESNCLIFSEMVVSGDFNRLSGFELAKFLSCFAEIKLPECDRNHNYTMYTRSYEVSNCIHFYKTKIEIIYSYEESFNVKLVDYNPIQYDLLYYMDKWYHEEEKEYCLSIIEEARKNGISLGEWIKAILKITKMSKEIYKAAVLSEQYELALKLKEIPEKILKSVCINQSLYH
jgi:superfamily II RNA helicase